MALNVACSYLVILLLSLLLIKGLVPLYWALKYKPALGAISQTSPLGHGDRHFAEDKTKRVQLGGLPDSRVSVSKKSKPPKALFFL